MEYDHLLTEQVNANTSDIDISGSTEIVRLINEEDKKVAYAVESVLPEITLAVDMITAKLREGGRLLYIGAGTSGRLGVLDASECPPTFGVDPELVVGVIAGGFRALYSAVEKTEDSEEQGCIDISSKNVCRQDVVVGISASGCTPYVAGALDQAKSVGAATIAICNTSSDAFSKSADIMICALVGPEVIMGSTRMKAGTAQKMILNMLTTASMISLGKTYQNYMVDLTPTNNKLLDRVVRIIMEITGGSRQSVVSVLAQTGNKPKPAIIMIMTGCDLKTAENALNVCEGVVRKAIESIKSRG